MHNGWAISDIITNLPYSSFNELASSIKRLPKKVYALRRRQTIDQRAQQTALPRLALIDAQDKVNLIRCCHHSVRHRASEERATIGMPHRMPPKIRWCPASIRCLASGFGSIVSTPLSNVPPRIIPSRRGNM